MAHLAFFCYPTSRVTCNQWILGLATRNSSGRSTPRLLGVAPLTIGRWQLCRRLLRLFVGSRLIFFSCSELTLASLDPFSFPFLLFTIFKNTLITERTKRPLHYNNRPAYRPTASLLHAITLTSSSPRTADRPVPAPPTFTFLACHSAHTHHPDYLCAQLFCFNCIFIFNSSYFPICQLHLGPSHYFLSSLFQRHLSAASSSTPRPSPCLVIEAHRNSQTRLPNSNLRRIV